MCQLLKLNIMVRDTATGRSEMHTWAIFMGKGLKGPRSGSASIRGFVLIPLPLDAAELLHRSHQPELHLASLLLSGKRISPCTVTYPLPVFARPSSPPMPTEAPLFGPLVLLFFIYPTVQLLFRDR